MFEDSNRTLDIVNDNLTGFLQAILKFINDVLTWFKGFTEDEPKD